MNKNLKQNDTESCDARSFSPAPNNTLLGKHSKFAPALREAGKSAKYLRKANPKILMGD